MENQQTNNITYTNQKGMAAQATVVNFFQIGEKNYIFYTTENLENRKADDSIALFIGEYNKSNKTILKIEEQDFQNMALNVACTIGSYSLDNAQIDLETLKQKVAINDFKMLPLSFLDKNDIVEEKDITQKAAPYKYIKAMEKACIEADKQVQQIETPIVDEDLTQSIDDKSEESIYTMEEEPEVTTPEVTEEIKSEDGNVKESPAVDEETIKAIEDLDKEIAAEEENDEIKLEKPNSNNNDVVIDDETIRLIEKLAKELRDSEDEMSKKLEGKTQEVKESIKEESNLIVSKYMNELDEYCKKIEEERNIQQEQIFAELSEKFMKPLLEQVSEISQKTQSLADENKRYKDTVEEYKLENDTLKQELGKGKDSNEELQLTISDLKTKLEDEKIANSSHVETIKTRDEEIRRKDKTIEEKEEANLSLQKDNGELKLEINKLNSKISDSEVQYQQGLSSKDEEIKSLKQQSEVDKNTIASQTSMIENKNEEIRNLTDQLKEASQREFEIKQALGLQGPVEQHKTR